MYLLPLGPFGLNLWSCKGHLAFLVCIVKYIISILSYSLHYIQVYNALVHPIILLMSLWTYLHPSFCSQFYLILYHQQTWKYISDSLSWIIDTDHCCWNPSTNLCSTPVVLVSKPAKDPCIPTIFFLYDNQISTHVSRVPPNPYVLMLLASVHRLPLLKAFWKSKYWSSLPYKCLIYVQPINTNECLGDQWWGFAGLCGTAGIFSHGGMWLRSHFWRELFRFMSSAEEWNRRKNLYTGSLLFILLVVSSNSYNTLPPLTIDFYRSVISCFHSPAVFLNSGLIIIALQSTVIIPDAWSFGGW